MGFSKIYVNGSSLSAGGGLDNIGIQNEYRKLYGLEWKDEKMVTYGKYIADHFKSQFVNDAVSGSGAPRLIRRTYEFIKKHSPYELKNILFIFEITDPIHRVDLYVNDIADYVVTNVQYSSNTFNDISEITLHQTKTSYGVEYDYDYFKKNITEDAKNYLNKFYNPIDYTDKIAGDLIGLFSFLELNNLNYFYMFDSLRMKHKFDYYYKKLDAEHDLCFDNYLNINQFVNRNILTIKDETNNFTGDTHPGYFGYQKYAEKIIPIIESKLK